MNANVLHTMKLWTSKVNLEYCKSFAFSVTILTIITVGVTLVVRGITATLARLAIHIRVIQAFSTFITRCVVLQACKISKVDACY